MEMISWMNLPCISHKQPENKHEIICTINKEAHTSTSKEVQRPTKALKNLHKTENIH
jgi:sucrose-6-phosphate hydrolase SacC (GH32 family)